MWSKDFNSCPSGNQPFLARRISKGKYKYAVVIRAPKFYRDKRVTFCTIVGVGKGFQADEWCYLPREGEEGHADHDIMRKALMEIAAVKGEPTSKRKAQAAMEQIKN